MWGDTLQREILELFDEAQDRGRARLTSTRALRRAWKAYLNRKGLNHLRGVRPKCVRVRAFVVWRPEPLSKPVEPSLQCDCGYSAHTSQQLHAHRYWHLKRLKLAV